MSIWLCEAIFKCFQAQTLPLYTVTNDKNILFAAVHLKKRQKSDIIV